MEKVLFKEEDLSFDKEWGEHKAIHEWWYATGILQDDDKNLYTFQFTIVANNMIILKPWTIMLAITNFKDNEHLFYQKNSLYRKEIQLTDSKIEMNGSYCSRSEQGMNFKGIGENFSYALNCEFTKDLIWHGDKGILQMGTDSSRDRSYYCSITNMATRGFLTIDHKKIPVKGLTWFDKQGGPFNLFSTKTHWEWFSLRFYDGEEIMLFHYPNHRPSCDGTYILKNGESKRVQDYVVKPLEFMTAHDLKFSSSWSVEIPGIKEEYYEIVPMMKGQLNLYYFENLCRILNAEGTEVGLCFTELLPGVYNEHIPLTGLLEDFK
ncbi:MAG: lipocalin-like domain-containing protein [Tissierellia bacterium]|nr:lipocalin-like domain-containing protein [Tissierellia bacterium]